MGSLVTHPVPLAILGALLLGFSYPAALALVARYYGPAGFLKHRIDRVLPGISGLSSWLVARDVLSFAVFLRSFYVRQVDWRGRRYKVRARGTLVRAEDLTMLRGLFLQAPLVRRFRRRRRRALSGQARGEVLSGIRPGSPSRRRWSRAPSSSTRRRIATKIRGHRPRGQEPRPGGDAHLHPILQIGREDGGDDQRASIETSRSASSAPRSPSRPRRALSPEAPSISSPATNSTSPSKSPTARLGATSRGFPIGTAEDDRSQ